MAYHRRNRPIHSGIFGGRHSGGWRFLKRTASYKQSIYSFWRFNKRGSSPPLTRLLSQREHFFKKIWDSSVNLGLHRKRLYSHYQLVVLLEGFATGINNPTDVYPDSYKEKYIYGEAIKAEKFVKIPWNDQILRSPPKSAKLSR